MCNSFKSDHLDFAVIALGVGKVRSQRRASSAEIWNVEHDNTSVRSQIQRLSIHFNDKFVQIAFGGIDGLQEDVEHIPDDIDGLVEEKPREGLSHAVETEGNSCVRSKPEIVDKHMIGFG